MSRTLNLIQLIGWSTTDASVRTIGGGSQVANFTLAVEGSRKDSDAQFLKISVGGELAAVAGDLVKKGSQVFVAGPLETRAWKGADGRERKTTEVLCRKFIVLGSKDEDAALQRFAAGDGFGDDLAAGVGLSPYI